MAKRRAKKTVKRAASVAAADSSPVNSGNGEEPPVDKNDDVALIEQEVERQGAAIRAICDVEIEHLLTGLCLLRSYFNKEQLQTPAMQFFKENLPNVAVVRNGANGQIEMQWDDRDGNISMDHGGGRDIHASLLRNLSIAYPDYSATVPSFGGFEFSTKSVKTSRLGVDNLQIKDFVLDEPFDTMKLGMQDTLQTPRVSRQRLSLGMTPKTLRLPKHGEMLLSVHGSPLGVYKEDSMEAINESEEC